MTPEQQSLLDSANESIHIIVRLLPLSAAQAKLINFSLLVDEIERLRSLVPKIERAIKD